MDQNLDTFRRGVIEGFFGRQWSWEDRRRYATFLRDHGFGFYVYAPKGDRIIREDWPDPWPEQTFESLLELGETYRSTGLAWGIGLNLFELHCRYDEEAVRALERKVRYLNRLQPDILAILFDDMTGEIDEIARIQVEVVDRAAALTTATTVVFCPTYYSDSPSLDRLFGERPPDYLESLGRSLDPEVHVFWTGPEVCSEAYPIEHLQSVGERLGRKPFLWDNYPVNDSERMCRHLHLRGFENRPRTMVDWISGHAVNPMNQAWLSRIPLATLGASYREGEAYDPAIAFGRAARALLGDDFAACLEEDLALFQDQGLDAISGQDRERLIRRYDGFDTPYNREIIGWLKGDYPYALDCMTE